MPVVSILAALLDPLCAGMATLTGCQCRSRLSWKVKTVLCSAIFALVGTTPSASDSPAAKTFPPRNKTGSVPCALYLSPCRQHHRKRLRRHSGQDRERVRYLRPQQQDRWRELLVASWRHRTRATSQTASPFRPSPGVGEIPSPRQHPLNQLLLRRRQCQQVSIANSGVLWRRWMCNC